AMNPGSVVRWSTDKNLNILAAEATTSDGGSEILVRDTPQASWRSLIKVGPEENLGLVDVTDDGKGVVIESSIGSDTARVIRRDIATGAEKAIASSDQVDAGIVQVNPNTRVVEAVSFEPGRRTWNVIDPSVRSDFEGIAKLNDGDFAIVNRDYADKNWLVAFTSDHGPTRWYVWDRTARKGTLLFSAQPKLDNLQLAQMKPVVIKTRDGMNMNAYLTLPAGVEP